jgi:hypothetical protein
MHEDAWSKAERYRQAANRYGDLAKQAEPGYLAEVYRKIAVPRIPTRKIRDILQTA